MEITHVLERVDALSSLLDLTANDLRNELGSELCESAGRGLALNDLDHLFSDSSNLGRCGVGGLLDLVWAALGERNGEEAEEVVIGGLDCDVGLNERLPLAHQRSKLVGSEIETVEVRQAVLSLNFVDTELDLSERVVLILLEISQRHLEDSALQSIICVLKTSSPVDKSLSNTVLTSQSSSYRREDICR
jgi:hypothetical protein